MPTKQLPPGYPDTDPYSFAYTTGWSSNAYQSWRISAPDAYGGFGRVRLVFRRFQLGGKDQLLVYVCALIGSFDVMRRVSAVMLDLPLCIRSISCRIENEFNTLEFAGLSKHCCFGPFLPNNCNLFFVCVQHCPHTPRSKPLFCVMCPLGPAMSSRCLVAPRQYPGIQYALNSSGTDMIVSALGCQYDCVQWVRIYSGVPEAFQMNASLGLGFVFVTNPNSYASLSWPVTFIGGTKGFIAQYTTDPPLPIAAISNRTCELLLMCVACVCI